MKTLTLTIQSIPVVYYIGRSQQENHAVLDLGGPTDLWFHLADTSSCHVVAILPADCPRKLCGAIQRRGAALCREWSRAAGDAAVLCVRLSDVQKTTVPGTVQILGPNLLRPK